MKNWNSFFGTKLNSLLLLILIILMVVAIRIMLKDKATYLPFLTEQTAQTSQITGNKDDLVSFSILPGAKVHGVVSYQGVVKNNYFFEANIIMHVLNSKKEHVVETHGTATTDWMTSGPVTFKGTLDFSSLPKGTAYIEIHNDNPSDLKENDKSIQFPIVIE